MGLSPLFASSRWNIGCCSADSSARRLRRAKVLWKFLGEHVFLGTPFFLSPVAVGVRTQREPFMESEEVRSS